MLSFPAAAGLSATWLHLRNRVAGIVKASLSEKITLSKGDAETAFLQLKQQHLVVTRKSADTPSYMKPDDPENSIYSSKLKLARTDSEV